MYAEAIGTVMYQPEIKESKAGHSYVRWTMCDRQGCRGKDDNDHTVFVDCMAFGKLGDFVMQWGSRGAALIVRGQVSVGAYVGKDGNPKGRATLIADKVEFAPKAKQYDGEPSPAPRKTTRDELGDLADLADMMPF